jgi:hypothetical protein
MSFCRLMGKGGEPHGPPPFVPESSYEPTYLSTTILSVNGMFT